MSNITSFMNTLLADYKQLRGKSKDSGGKKFWDLVVITTADRAQEEAFQRQIDEKFSRNELPLDLPIHVVSDPPGVRIGNGGSTLTALEFLENKYGAKVFQMKILLIHAGGWSQRMPSASVLGKIFSLLPHGTPPYQMLDLKLALYWPFVERIGPGVFLVCADDFIVYGYGDGEEWTIPENGFTALAHPSSIEIGRTHGVFVVDGDVDANIPVQIRECQQALQKPNDETMIAKGALINGYAHIDGQAVYTDSSFYFGVDVMKKLLDFKRSVGDLHCEIDAYGDFLQAVGSRASNDYIHQTSNVSQLTSNLSEMRSRVFRCLNGSDFHVLVLNASAFIHIGTAKELLYHFCEDNIFKERMGFENNIFNGLTRFISDSDTIECYCMSPDLLIPSNACLMHSLIHADSEIGEQCVIEYCDFEYPVHVMPGCIASNCQLVMREASLDNYNIPIDCFLHTIPVQVNNETKYVSIFFKTNDDLKKSICVNDLENLSFMGSNIRHFLHTHKLQKENILPHVLGDSNSFEKSNLWNLKLYPAKLTMTSSFEAAISSLSLLTSPEPQDSVHVNNTSETYLSLADILSSKDVEQMLGFRKTLHDKLSRVNSNGP